jgi:riboflavin kinase/FMN adenylyltransferase
MNIYRDLELIPSDFGPSIVSVGNFDGVHLAHQAVLKQVVQRARETGSKAVVVTFDPHPVRILHPDKDLKLITPGESRIRLLADTGIDAALILPFTRDLSVMSAHHFVEQILVGKLHAKEIHEGFNFHFGHKAKGNVQLLEELAPRYGFVVKVYPEMKIRGAAVSSSQIRKLVQSAEVSRVRHLIGRVFSIHSTPGRGRGYGHKYTVPTINLSRYDELIPQNGVYITRSKIGEECFDSVTNVGVRPTFGQDSFAIESHLLNFHPIELTAETPVELSFLKHLRPEMKFPSVDELREQIARDVHRARRYFQLLKLQSPAS